MFALIDKLRAFVLAKLAVIYLRYLIGFAFVFASFIKIQGERFTRIPTSEPVGYFFEAMYQTGFYWKFLGWTQLIAGSLLMTQRFGTIGAIIFLPIILNVCLITHSINFGTGTPMITTLMLLGTIFLILWDYKKWIILFYRDQNIRLDLTQEPQDKFMEDPTWIIAGVVFVALTASASLFEFPREYFVWWILTMMGVGVGAFAIVMSKKYYFRTI